ncbi:MAG: hypothetical protein MN733_10060, partial [Nitrososphaera sp.]|nr:hypothetical protein [Nitrososphaera sp.]
YLEGVIEWDKWHPQRLPLFAARVESVVDYPLWSHEIQKSWIPSFSKHVRLWGDYFFDFSGFYAFTQLAERLIEQSATGQYVWAMYIVATRNTGTNRFPFVPSCLDASPFVYSLGIYHMIPQEDAKGVAKVQAVSEELLEACIDFQGRPYLYGAYKLTPDRLARLYGADYSNLLRLRHELDPQELLNPAAFPGNA